MFKINDKVRIIGCGNTRREACDFCDARDGRGGRGGFPCYGLELGRIVSIKPDGKVGVSLADKIVLIKYSDNIELVDDKFEKHKQRLLCSK